MLGAVIASVNVNAQSSNVVERQSIEESGERAEQTSEWYNYGGTIYGFGGETNYYRNTMFPDSTVVVQGSSDYFNVWIHSLGQTFDPTSFYYEIDGNTVISEEVSYVIDSIAIPYRYYRPQDGNPDTLFVQAYVGDKHNTGTFNSGQTYATVDYDHTSNLGADADYTEVILLDNQDTITSQQGVMFLDLGLNVGADELFSVTFSYKPGNEVFEGDTIDVYTTDNVVNKRNAFIAYTFYDTDKNPDEGYYNNGLLVTTDVRYNQNSNGWNGNYISGYAYSNGFYHTDINFKMSTLDNSIADGVEDFIAVVPNPANDYVQIQTDKKVELVEVYSATGTLVKAVNIPDNNRVGLDDLSTGLYIVKVIVDGELSVSRIYVGN